MKFTKIVSSLDQQIELLRQRGLQIANTASAKIILSNVSYYRLSIYMRYFQKPGSQHEFKEGTTLEEVYELYTFDRELKLIIFDAIETLEVTFRNQLTLHVATVHGNNWYENPGLFNDYRNDTKLEKNFHNTLMTHISNEFDTSEERFITHYKSTYNDPKFPPSWMILEILTFGKLSRIYQHLNCSNEKREICHYFKTHDNIFPSWLHSLGYMRNICAHHSRLVGRKLTITPTLPTRKNNRILNEDVTNNSLYAYLSIIAYLIKSIQSQNNYISRVRGLIDQFPGLDITEFGFTADWKNEPLWNI